MRTPSNPRAENWNTDPQGAYRRGVAGVVGGGTVAQVYVHGETAYDVTLRGLTFDNVPSREEVEMYATGLGGGAARADGLQDEPQPAHRFASVAVRGAGFGDDAGPRLITIEDCRFAAHRGYAVLVSPGIKRPDIPVVPVFVNPRVPTARADDPGAAAEGDPAVNLQSSGQLYKKDEGGRDRRLDLRDDARKYIAHDGLVAHNDQTLGAEGTNYLDGRRVKIAGTEFLNSRMAEDNVAGLVTSAYSLTVTNCLFLKNEAKGECRRGRMSVCLLVSGRLAVLVKSPRYW